jgi:predicted XRE-type DNA-binding protein
MEDTTVLSPEDATIDSLRRDVALQIARFAARIGITQSAAARQLGIPQPTLSKIINGRVADLSLELLIRVAVRGGLPLALQTGHGPQEAGAYVAANSGASLRVRRSRLADEARDLLRRSERSLTPSQRLEAFLEHNQLMAALRQADRASEGGRARAFGPTR